MIRSLIPDHHTILNIETENFTPKTNKLIFLSKNRIQEKLIEPTEYVSCMPVINCSINLYENVYPAYYLSTIYIEQIEAKSKQQTTTTTKILSWM